MSDYDKPKRELNWWENYPGHRLWCNDLLPLVPRFRYRKGDEWNSNNWGLHWLVLHVWTMEHASLQADIEVSTSSISLGFVLPYLRVCIGIRNWHNRVGIWLSDTTRRKPAIPRIELTKEELQALEAHNRELGVLARVPSRLK